MRGIRDWAPEFDEYRRDESRAMGEASSISFPADEAEIRAVLAELERTAPDAPITVQGPARVWPPAPCRTAVMCSTFRG